MSGANKVLERIKAKCLASCPLWKLRDASVSGTFETRKNIWLLSQIRVPFWCIRKAAGYGSYSLMTLLSLGENLPECSFVSFWNDWSRVSAGQMASCTLWGLERSNKCAIKSLRRRLQVPTRQIQLCKQSSYPGRTWILIYNRTKAEQRQLFQLSAVCGAN